MASTPRRATRSPRARQRSSSTVTRVEVEADRGVFMISVAAELASMHPQTLRMYEARGLIEPQRSAKGTRLYSHRDVERLRRIQAMTADLGLNLAGVERVLELEARLAEMQTRVEELELQALQAKVRLAKELEEMRRSFRAELVPYQGGTDVVRAVDVSPPFGLTSRPDRARARGGKSQRRESNGS
jgi:MerR family transcriptional regulator/heat shock protein HspR